MPFDGSGNYALSDTIAPATNADANELQAILTDIGTALDACVVADGQSPISGALKGSDGTAALPAYSFNADLNSGWYRIGADNIGLSLGGTKRWDFGTATSALTGALTVSTTITPSGQVLSSDGTKTAPGYSFSSDVDTGVYRIGANNLGVSCGDTKILDIATTGMALTGLMTISSTLNVTGIITGSHAAPTVQRITATGAGTYTPAAGMIRIKVRMVGGGGGGGARATNAGNSVTASTASSFDTWTANPGAGGAAAGGAAGAGGSGGTDGTGTLVVRAGGGDGCPGLSNTVANVVPNGGTGGNNPFGGAGAGGTAGGSNGKANTGAGGGGGGGVSTSSSGSGGGAGEYVEFWMTAAQIGASKAYVVGVAGVGGAAGGAAGGNGAAGGITIEEFYS